jgi:hypothetical protein
MWQFFRVVVVKIVTIEGIQYPCGIPQTTQFLYLQRKRVLKQF